MKSQSIIYAGNVRSGKTRILLSTLVEYVQLNKNDISENKKHILFLGYDDYIANLYKIVYEMIFRNTANKESKRLVDEYFNSCGYHIEFVNMLEQHKLINDVIFNYIDSCNDETLECLFIDNIINQYPNKDMNEKDLLMKSLFEYTQDKNITVYASTQLNRTFIVGKTTEYDKLPNYLSSVDSTHVIYQDENLDFKTTNIKNGDIIYYRMNRFGQLCEA